jgi:hypothetical protein
MRELGQFFFKTLFIRVYSDAVNAGAAFIALDRLKSFSKMAQSTEPLKKVAFSPKQVHLAYVTFHVHCPFVELAHPLHLPESTFPFKDCSLYGCSQYNGFS